MKKLITVDFDDTLCFSDNLEKPNTKLITKIKSLDKNKFTVVVVTARNREYDSIYANVRIKDFIKKYKLPIKKIYFTSGKLKGPYLKKLNSSIHIDNDEKEISSCKECGVKTIHVKQNSF